MSDLTCSTTFSHPDCDALCKDIAKKSNGVCFLMISGKDSIACALYLKQFFKRIIGFTCASYPGAKCHKAWMDYLEEALGIRILRLVGEELPMSLKRGMYQTPDEIQSILEMPDVDTNKIEILEWLRKEFSLPRAWCAVGLSCGDSIDRRIYIKKNGGRVDSHLTFYPLGLAERADILSIIRNSGIKLPDSYLYSCRSLGAMPGYTILKIMREHYPEDYNLILSCWPLAEGKTYREMMLNAINKRRRAEGIFDDARGVSHDGEDAGVDVIPELMGEEGAGVDEQ